MAVVGSKNEQGSYPVMIFQESQTWACPVAMEAIVYVIGAGGSGAAVGGSYDSSYNCRGGAAGGCAVSRLSLAQQDYTIVIGSGGGQAGNNQVGNGNAGGNSSFAGTGISTMTANGGAGGTQSNSAQAITTGGGTATGGNLMNNTGGGGGSTNANQQTSSGGGVNLYGTDTNGTNNVSNSGFGAGGRPHGHSTSATRATGDRGYYNNGRYDYSSGLNEDVAVNFFPNLIAHQSGVPNSPSGTAGFGLNIPLAGSKQGTMLSTYNTANAIYGVNAPFCGGHCVYSSAGSSGRVIGCAGGVGAGGGGTMATSGDAHSGPGGSGLVMIFPIQLG